MYSVQDEIFPYVITEEIGRGAYATVYLGINQENNEKVAIKKMKKFAMRPDL